MQIMCYSTKFYCSPRKNCGSSSVHSKNIPTFKSIHTYISLPKFISWDINIMRNFTFISWNDAVAKSFVFRVNICVITQHTHQLCTHSGQDICLDTVLCWLTNWGGICVTDVNDNCSCWAETIVVCCLFMVQETLLLFISDIFMVSVPTVEIYTNHVVTWYPQKSARIQLANLNIPTLGEKSLQCHLHKGPVIY